MNDYYDPMAEVTFPQERPVQEKSMTPVTVRVTGPWQVAYAGDLFYEGQQATVPEYVAQEWEQAGHVERLQPAPKRAVKTK